MAPSSTSQPKNQSWRLTHEQIQDMFIQNDLEGDASLDIEELHKALIRLGLPATRKHVRSLFAEMDLDQDDKVDIPFPLFLVRYPSHMLRSSPRPL
jgi:Ca2+-binding EF-hand superfamily protein